MSIVHAYASMSHYAEHLRPILAALPPEIRGQMWAPRDGLAWGMAIPPELQHQGSHWFLVAAYVDAQALQQHPLVYVEHGAGQTYVGLEQHGSYSGGDHRGLDVRLYLAPGEHVAARWRAAGAAVATVGCPKLDAWLDLPAPPARTVALAWHWANELVPEAGTAFQHYEQALWGIIPWWAEQGIDVIGHAHPRVAGKIARFCQEWGIPFVADLRSTLASSSILVADNTSALYEAAAIGRGTLVLNAPWFRRDVEHGLRFWSHVPGPQADDPDGLAYGVVRALAEPEWGAEERRAAVAHVYAHLDRSSAARAARAIVEATG